MVEREAILADNSIIDKEFPQVALKDLPILPWSIPEEELNRRRDLRSERIFSIDPVTAKDLDDALHIKQLEDGFFEVGVHIADVSYFLKKGSALDNEAKDRGTSTYLVDSVIPMLPPVLCEELCSLNPGVDR
jgi:protein SSD1